MQVYLLIAVGGLALIWYVGAAIANFIGDGLNNMAARRAARRAENENKKKLAIAAAEQAKFEEFRTANPVRIVGIPNPDAYHRVFKALDELTVAANNFRPQMSGTTDSRFKTYKFPTHRFAFPRPHPDSFSQTDPVKITITADDLAMSGGLSMVELYENANESFAFPYARPDYQLDASNAPVFPNIQKPPQRAVKLLTQDNIEVDDRSDGYWRQAYESELNKVAMLNTQVATLFESFEWKYSAAVEAFGVMDLYLDGLKLKLKDIQAEYVVRKSAFERECEEATRPLRMTSKLYDDRAPQGIKQHFTLALSTLTLPLPTNYHWEVFYDENERLLQVNQCVPSLADITVKRVDNNRAPTKRDAESALRRYVPAIALQLAYMVAINDLNNDVDTIAINCWSRFFEPSSGRLKDAFVAALTVKKEEIQGMNLQRADSLEAFRALRGAFVYSLQDVVPIEPLIRLDKTDDRFVAGRDVLDGMAQGQNLAAMDWQDFEHLIRELLSKEYASETSEVKITRASRDRGVDAVVFNSDPLHGGKFVVQAKRYTNTVDVSAVRELYGTVLNEGANRGILVTTSHYGRDAYEWAANKPLTLIDGPNLLSLLSKHGYRFRIENVRP
jgi:restriction system protein